MLCKDNRVEKNNSDINQDKQSQNTRQQQRQNPLLRDLIRILILNQLFRPGRPPFIPGPGFPGFPPSRPPMPPRPGRPPFRPM